MGVKHDDSIVLNLGCCAILYLLVMELMHVVGLMFFNYNLFEHNPHVISHQIIREVD